MEIKITTHDQTSVFHLAGSLDAETAPQLEEKIETHLNNDNLKLILNLQELEYISSAGLRVILIFAKKMAIQNGKFTICGLTGTVAKVFKVSGFESLIPVQKTLQDAINSL